jgi:hypothetical protein
VTAIITVSSSAIAELARSSVTRRSTRSDIHPQKAGPTIRISCGTEASTPICAIESPTAA